MTILVQRTFLVAALIFAVMSYPPTMRADSKQADAKTLAEARALLDKAEKLSRLTEKGGPPFAVHATIESGEGKQKQTADFYLLWQDGEHWRAMAVEGDNREIHIRNPEGLLLPRLPNAELMPVFNRGAAFPFQSPVLAWDEPIDGIRDRKTRGRDLGCVRSRTESAEREICIDRGSGLVQQIEYRRVGNGREFSSTAQPTVLTNMKGNGGFSVGSAPIVTEHSEEIEYGDYVKPGEKWVPKRIRWTVDGHFQSELHLVSLGADPKVAPQLFTATEGYDLWPYCEHYKYAGMNSMMFPVTPGSKVAEAALVAVAPDGEAREARLINATGRSGNEWLTMLRKQAYRPATCDGHPVLGFFFLPLRP